MQSSSKRPAAPIKEDTVLKSLSRAERAKLAMDAWEPSLLRQLLRPRKPSQTERCS